MCKNQGASTNQPPQRVQWSKARWCSLFTHKPLCSVLYSEAERSREAEQHGVQSKRTNSVPGPVVTSQDRNIGFTFKFKANPVQLQLNQFDPSRGRSSPSWLIIPNFLLNTFISKIYTFVDELILIIFFLNFKNVSVMYV